MSEPVAFVLEDLAIDTAWVELSPLMHWSVYDLVRDLQEEVGVNEVRDSLVWHLRRETE